MEADKSRLTRDLSYFPRTGTVSPIVTSRRDLIDRILGIDLPGLKEPGSYSATGAGSQSITDINYRAPGT